MEFPGSRCPIAGTETVVNRSDRQAAIALLEALRQRRVVVEAAGDKLRLRAPRGAITRQQRDALGRLKPTVLALLSEETRIDGGNGHSVSQTAPDLTEGRLPPIDRGLWFLAQLDPGDPSYHVGLVVKLRGALDPERLGQALDALLDRHTILRATYFEAVEGPRWRVAPRDHSAPTLATIDGTPWTEAEQQAWIDQTLEAPFDLEHGPVFRASLADTGRGRQTLVLSWHHLVGDARSAGILLRDLERFYLQHSSSPQREALQPYRRDLDTQHERIEEQLGWWRRRLDPPPPALELPSDRRRDPESIDPASPRPPSRGSCLARPLDPALIEALRARGRQTDATLFMVTAAAVQLLLARLTGQSRIALAVPVDQRDQEQTDAVGLWVNPVVVDVDLDTCATVDQLLASVRRAALDAFDHAAVPLADLVRVVAPPRHGTRSPLVSVMFNVADVRSIRLDLPGIEAEVSLVEPGSRYDLTVYLLLDGPQTRLEVAWDRELFDAARIEALLEQLETLLDQLAAPKDLLLNQLTLETPKPAEGTLAPPPQISESWLPRVATWARRDPSRKALEGVGGSESYGTLWAAASTVAQHLRDAGVYRGDVVVIEGQRSTGLAVHQLGVFLAGGAVAVLDPELPEERLAKAVATWGPRAWIESEEPERFGALRARNPEIPSIQGPKQGETSTFATPQPVRVDGLALAWVPCTSGTTGEPRAIATPHSPIAHYLRWCAQTFDLGPADRFALLAGLGHDPLMRDLWLPLILGATLVCPPARLRRDGDGLAHWLANEAITVVHLPPALGELLVLAGVPLPKLRWVFFGGDVLPTRTVARLLELAPAARCVNLYGTTETPQGMAFHPVSAHDLRPTAARSVPLGRGIDGVTVEVVAANGLDRAGMGELGEIVVATPHLAWGYLGKPAATAERFVPDPAGPAGGRRYRTGDLGRRRLDGGVDLVGRRDRQLQVRGFRVEPGEIEAELVADPAVATAVVRPFVPGHSTPPGTSEAPTELAAWVVPAPEAPNASELVDRLRRRLRRELPAPLVPRLTLVPALPLTANGKVDARALPHPEASVSAAADQAPRTAREVALATLWSELLGVAVVPRDASFFELGGHSLLIPKLLTRIRALFGSAPSLAEIFHRSTLADLAQAIERSASNNNGARAESGPRALDPAQWRPSSAQRRLWFLHRLAPSSPAYHLARAFEIEGPLDALALDRALCALVDRQQGLRVAFPGVEGQPQAVLQPAPGHVLKVLDLRWLPPNRLDVEVERLSEAEARRPFDLAQGPMLRARLLRLDEQRHRLLLTLHHIAADAASIPVLRRDLAQLYAAEARGKVAHLPALRWQVGDLVHWQAQAKPTADNDLEWWRQQLATVPPLQLTLARPAGTCRRGRVERRCLDAALTRELRSAARHFGTTLFVTLLSAWKLLLARLGATDDLAVGTAVQQRPAEADGLVGLFLDTLVLRTRLDLSRDFAALVRQVHNTLLAALAHQSVGFERLVEALAPDRSLDQSPLFQTFFNLVDVREHGFELPGLTLVEQPRREGLTAKLDLALNAVDSGDHLELRLVYDGHRFEEPVADQMLAQLEAVLRQALAGTAGPVASFELTTPESATLLPDPRQPQPWWEPPSPLAQLWEWVAQTPEAPALVEGDHTTTYAALGLDVEHLAHRLSQAGLQPGQRVALHGLRNRELIVALLAVWRAGGVVLLVDPSLPRARRRWMAERAEIEWVVDLALDDPTDEAWHGVDPDSVVRQSDLKPLDGVEADLAGELPGDAIPEVDPRDAAYVVFTSGSSGEPKGVLGSHGALGHFLQWQRQEFEVGPGDRVALLAALSFDAVLRDVLLPLTSGATLVVPEPDVHGGSPGLIPWLRAQRVTLLHWIPSLAQSQLDEGEAPPLPEVRGLFMVGEPLAASLVKAYQSAIGGEVVNFYGPTETTLIRCFERISQGSMVTRSGPWVPVGRSIPDTQALVLRPDRRLCGIGEPGEIVLRTPFRSLGFLPPATDPFVPNPFLRQSAQLDGPDAVPEDRLYPTGDRGCWLPDGSLMVLGRLDRQVKIRGLRIEPGEIETALLSLPGVAEAAVVADGDPTAPDRRLVAFWVSNGESLSESRDLRGELRTVLPEALVPTVVTRLEAMPRTATGKLDRRALDRAYRQPNQGFSEALERPPQSTWERRLAELWQELLQPGRPIHLDDDFFALGGHSLLATRLVARLDQHWALQLPLRACFEWPRLEDLARRLDTLEEPQGTRDRPSPPTVTTGPAPLSFHQERLWFLERFEEAPGAYHVTRSLPLTGDLEPPALEAALASLVVRHEILRTAIVERGDTVYQEARPSPETHPCRVDLSGLTPPRQRAARRWVSLVFNRRCFDLGVGALLRVAVLDLGQRRWELVLGFHHLAIDAPSLEIFARELALLYPAAVHGLEALATAQRTLPQLQESYRDYARWQRAHLDASQQQRSIDFWRRQLADDAPLDLPTDRPRPTHGAHRGGRCPVDLGSVEAAALRDLAQQHRASPFMVLLAGFQALLHRLTTQRRLAVGTPINQRPRPSLEGVMGFFANTLVLPVDLEGTLSFVGLLERARTTCMAGYEHQELPFEVLVRELDPVRDPGRNPFFQAMLAFHQRPAEPLGLPGLVAGPVEPWGLVARFDLQWVVVDDGGVLRSSLEYSADLFDATTVQRWAGSLGRLLGAALESPDRPVSTLPLLTPAQEHQVVVAWNDQRRDFGEDHDLATLLQAQARRTPGAIAVESAGVGLSYAELDRRANRLAHHLRVLGVAPGGRVAVALERGNPLMVALLAVLKTGAAYVPLDLSYPVDRLVTILDDARCSVLLSDGPTPLDSWLNEAPSAAPRRVDLSEEARQVAAASDNPPAPSVPPEAAAYVIYTSGSTGRPKGVLCSHRSVVNRLRWMQRAFPLTSDDRVLQKTPVGFDVSVWELFWPLLVGARLVMARPDGHKDTAYLAEVLAQRRITTLHFVPSMLRIFLDEHGLAAQGDQGSEPVLRQVFTSGEALPRDLAERFIEASDAALHNLYGPTEAAVDVSWEPMQSQPGAAVAIGRPIDNLRLVVADRRLQAAPLGVAGELLIGGVGLAQGYLGRPSLTADRFVPDPFSGKPGARLYHTGDRVRQRTDGRIDFLGRLDGQVKVRGFRVELGEIESHLVTHSEVGQAIAGQRSGRLVAWCVPPPGSQPTASALRAHLADRLPEPMIPSAWVVLDAAELPLLPNGKVDRSALPEPSEARAETRLHEPASPLEAFLARVWGEVLAQPVGRDDNFFELGGDSILSLRIVARAREQGLRLLPRDLFDHQTVGALARWVVEDDRQGTPPEPHLQGLLTGSAALTPIQQAFFEHRTDRPWHRTWTRLWRPMVPVTASRLPRIADRLELHHDGLRARFPVAAGPLGRQHFAAPGSPPATWIDLSALPVPRWRPTLERATAQVQTSLDLVHGPLWRLVGFSGPDQARRLLLSAHHLVVDGVSWTVLTEDLATLLRGDDRLPAKTTDLATWVEHLDRAAREPLLADEVPGWFARGAVESVEAPRAGSLNAQSTGPSTAPRDRRTTLPESLTTALEAQVRRHRLRWDDLLLAALALALRPHLGSTLRLDVEGHGRDALREGLDASRTVGWLTALFPIALRLPSDPVDPVDSVDPVAPESTSDLAALVRQIKQTLRSVPRGGVGFGALASFGEPAVAQRLQALPPRPVLFNFLGHRDRADGDPRAQVLQPAEESSGPSRDPRARPTHGLEVVAGIRGGHLELALTWDPTRFADAWVEALIASLPMDLARLVKALSAPGAHLATPSDFPLAGLDGPGLDRLVAERPELRAPNADATLGNGSGPRQALDDLYPTSATQEAIFYYHLYHPDSTAYRDHTSFVLEGDVDPDRVRRAGQRLLDRHAILRTTLLWKGLEEPLQAVWRRATLPWVELDWRHLDPQAQEQRLRRWIGEDRRQGYDLERPPLMRWTLMRLGARRYRLAWSYHHLILDGWSLPLLLHDFYRTYRDPDAPGEPIRPFRDYIAWLALHDRQRAAPFWRRALEGFDEATPLPWDRPPAEDTQGSTIRSLGLHLPEPTTEGLDALARRHRVTPNTLVQAAWGLVLARFAGHDDVVFGATLAGRPAEVAGVEGMVGLFINTLPVRLRRRPTATVATWLADLQAWNLEMRGVDDSRLFDLHQWSAVPPGQPLFESALLFQNYPRRDDPGLRDVGIEVGGFRAFGHTSYPLTLTAKPRRRMSLQLAYDTARFDPSTIRRLLNHLTHVCGELMRHSEGQLGDLAPLPRSERHQLLHSWSTPATHQEPAPDLVVQIFDQARTTPEALAVAEGERPVLTYEALTQRAGRLAQHLRTLGVRVDTPVGLFLHRSPESLVAVLAVLAAGGAYVPLDPLHPRKRLAWVLDELGIPVVLTQARLLDDLPETEAGPARQTLVVDALGDADPQRADGALAALEPERFVGGVTPAACPGEALASVLYTSGSTGRPKAVGTSRQALSRYVDTAIQCFALAPGRRMLQFAALGFDTSAEEIFPTLAAGGTLVLRNERMLESPRTFLDTLEAWQIEVLDLPTAYWHQLCAVLDASLDSGVDKLPASLQTVILGGEAARPDLLTRWHRVASNGASRPRLLNTYGPTEATIVVSLADLAPPSTEREADPSAVVSIGHPLPGTRLVVMDRWLEPMPLGAPGELCLGGERLARGYLRQPAKTAERFVPDPSSPRPGARLYRTGDRVRHRMGGDLEFLGRLDHQVKLRGLRIELGEVESVLREHRAVRDAVVVVDAADPANPKLVAHCTPTDPSQPPDRLGLRGFVRQQLPFYMVPSVLAVHAELPRTPSGKVDRQRLPTNGALTDGGAVIAPETEPPRNETEAALAELFATTLGLEAVAPRDEYFDLGGDSLLAVRLMARIERRFGVALSLADLFADFTVEGLARRLAPSPSTPSPPTQGAEKPLSSINDSKKDGPCLD